MLERIHKLIKQETVPPKSVIELLKDTYIGTQGTLYQLLDTETKIHTLHQPLFIYMERNQKAIGTATFCQRNVSINNQKKTTFYIRYFAFNKVFQGGDSSKKGISNFHKYLTAFFNTSNLNPILPEFEPRIYWAYIDPQNLRSHNFNNQFGFETIGSFRTTSFSRTRPKNFDVHRLKKEEHSGVSEQIEKFYSGFQLFSTTHLFKANNFFVLKENDKIICGIQANPVHWKIKSLPGIGGKILLKTARYIPGINKIIKPDNHKFLATEGLFWEEGHDHRVTELLEGVLAATEHFSLLIWTDDKNKMLTKLKINWGLLQRIKSDNKVNVVAKFNGYEPLEIERVRNAPKYISGFDLT